MARRAPRVGGIARPLVAAAVVAAALTAAFAGFTLAVREGSGTSRPAPAAYTIDRRILRANALYLAALADRCRSSFDASLHDPLCIAISRDPTEILSVDARRHPRLAARPAGG